MFLKQQSAKIKSKSSVAGFVPKAVIRLPMSKIKKG